MAPHHTSSEMETNHKVEGYLLFACVDLTLADGTGRIRGATYSFEHEASVCIPPRDSDLLRIPVASDGHVSVVVKSPDGMALGVLNVASLDSCLEPQLFDGWFCLDPKSAQKLDWTAACWKSNAESLGPKVRVLVRVPRATATHEHGIVDSALELQNFLLETLRAHGQRRLPLGEICNNVHGSTLLLPKSLSPTKQSHTKLVSTALDSHGSAWVKESENIKSVFQTCDSDDGDQLERTDAKARGGNQIDTAFHTLDSNLTGIQRAGLGQVRDHENIKPALQMDNWLVQKAYENTCWPSATHNPTRKSCPSELSEYLPKENSQEFRSCGAGDSDPLQGLTVFRQVRVQICGRSNPTSADASTINGLANSPALAESPSEKTTDGLYESKPVESNARSRGFSPCWQRDQLEAMPTHTQSRHADSSSERTLTKGVPKALSKVGCDLFHSLHQIKLDLVGEGPTHSCTQCWSARSSTSSARPQPEDEPQVVSTGKSHAIASVNNAFNTLENADSATKCLPLSAVESTWGSNSCSRAAHDELLFLTDTHAESTGSRNIGPSISGICHVGRPGIAWMAPEAASQNSTASHDVSFTIEDHPQDVSSVDLVEEEPQALRIRLPSLDCRARNLPSRNEDLRELLKRTKQRYKEDLDRMQAAQDAVKMEIAEAFRHGKKIKAAADAEEIQLNHKLQKLEALSSICEPLYSHNLEAGYDSSPQATALTAEQKRHDLHDTLLSLSLEVQGKLPEELRNNWMSGSIGSQLKEAQSQCNEAMQTWKEERQALALVDSELLSEEAAVDMAACLREEITQLQGTLDVQKSLIHNLTEQIACLEAKLSQKLDGTGEASGSEVRLRSEIGVLRAQIEEHSAILELEQGSAADWKRRALEYEAEVVAESQVAHQQQTIAECRRLKSQSERLQESRKSVSKQSSNLQQKVEEARASLRQTQVKLCSEAQIAQHEARLARNKLGQLQSTLLQRRLELESTQHQRLETEPAEVAAKKLQKSRDSSAPLHADSRIPAWNGVNSRVDVSHSGSDVAPSKFHSGRRARSLSKGAATGQRYDRCRRL